MDQIKTGALMRALRTALCLTQKELADMLHISDKTVSKWECGLGCPDVSLLPALSERLGVSVDCLLSGEIDPNGEGGSNMKKTIFYVCPNCGNILTASSGAAVSCCGKKLEPLVPVEAVGKDRLTVEQVELDYYITGNHEMTKTHFITFAALVTNDCMMLKRLYPEWNLQVRFPRIGRGILVWYCSQHGLSYQNL